MLVHYRPYIQGSVDNKVLPIRKGMKGYSILELCLVRAEDPGILQVVANLPSSGSTPPGGMFELGRSMLEMA